MKKIFNNIWNIVNYVQQSMLVHARLRFIILRIFGVKIHRSSKIASRVFIGSNKIEISEDVYININCFLDGSDRIQICEGVRIGPYVKILTGTHTMNPGLFRRRGTSADLNLPVVIQRGAWIGMGALLLPGVVIAEGCVIGAGAVVTKSTAPNGLYVGNPAKRAKDLPI